MRGQSSNIYRLNSKAKKLGDNLFAFGLRLTRDNDPGAVLHEDLRKLKHEVLECWNGPASTRDLLPLV